MRKQNCWEHKGCGREPGGRNAAALGECSAAAEKRAHGLNGGRNGGRACWALVGTFCRGEATGTFAARHLDCMACGFFQQVGREEGADYAGAKAIFARIHMHSAAPAQRPVTPRRKQIRR